MNSIEVMVNEHRYIKRMLKVIRQACYNIMQGEIICYEDFNKIVDFVRNYADKHHHGKEEKFLFNQMIEHLGELGSKLVRSGMYVEHDLGRLYMQDLEVALEKYQAGDEESKLDIIANAISYTHLLERHIAKEDNVVYKFAQDALPPEVLKQVHIETKRFENLAEENGVQKYYIGILEALEHKYLG